MKFSSRQNRFRMALRSLTFFGAAAWMSLPGVGHAIDAASVTFDDSTTTFVNGSQVQAALQSTDTQLISIDTTLKALPDPQTLTLRTSCPSSDPTCFTDLAALLAELNDPQLPGRSVPSASNPVKVDIGPGTFDLTSDAYPYCENLSHITFKGAGRKVTVLTGGNFVSAVSGPAIFNPYTVRIANCDDVEFLDLTIAGGGTRSGVAFEGDGESYWTDVEIAVSGNGHWAWVDGGSTSIASSIHYWNNSTLKTTSGIGNGIGALYAIKSSHRFAGSRLEVTATSGDIVYGALYGDATGFDLRVEGSRIIVHNTASTKNATAIFTGYVSAPCASGSLLTIAGSEIEAIATSGATATAIYNNCPASAPGNIQIQGTWFNMTGATTLRRFLGSAGGFNSPYSLGAGANPPSITTSWSSAKGMDSFTETDCSSTRCNSTSQGSQSHVLVFDAGCTTTGADYGPWFDTDLRQCRGI